MSGARHASRQRGGGDGLCSFIHLGVCDIQQTKGPPWPAFAALCMGLGAASMPMADGPGSLTTCLFC